jgi:cell division protein FtsL
MNTARQHLATLLTGCLSSSLRLVLVLSVPVVLALLFAVWSLAQTRAAAAKPEAP